MDGWMIRWLDGRMAGLMDDDWMAGWKDRWMGRWMGGWMDG